VERVVERIAWKSPGLGAAMALSCGIRAGSGRKAPGHASCKRTVSGSNPLIGSQAISAHRERMAEQHAAAEDYKAHLLRGGDGATIRTDWGGYRISGDFHFAWDWYAMGIRRSNGMWCCNSCFKPVREEHEREECHTCQDWGSCGGDCTLSRIFCPDYGTSRPI
jgi:hypothetical protein